VHKNGLQPSTLVLFNKPIEQLVIEVLIYVKKAPLQASVELKHTNKRAENEK